MSIWIRRSGNRRSGFVDLESSIWIRRSGFVKLDFWIAKMMSGPHPIRFRSASLRVLHIVVHLSNRRVRPLEQSESGFFGNRHNLMNRPTLNFTIASPHFLLPCRFLAWGMGIFQLVLSLLSQQTDRSKNPRLFTYNICGCHVASQQLKAQLFLQHGWDI